MEAPFPLKGTGPTRTLLMHVARCDWIKEVTTNCLIVTHQELGAEFFTAPNAQLDRWRSFTARRSLLDDLRARAEGETSGYARKDANGILKGFTPDLEANRLLLGNKVGDRCMELIPHCSESQSETTRSYHDGRHQNLSSTQLSRYSKH